MTKHKLTLYDGGNTPCPVGGCGCPWGWLVEARTAPHADGSECAALTFRCEWGHEWTVSFSEHDGAILHSVESRYYDEDAERSAGVVSLEDRRRGAGA